MGLLKTNLMLTLGMIVLTSCGNYEEFKEDPSSAFGDILPSTAVSFETIKTEVLEQNCFGCHPGYANYEDVLEKVNDGTMRTEIAAGTMPQNGAISDDKKRLLLSWIAAGAPRGVVTVEPDPTDVDLDILAPNFASISRNIIQKKCITCHNPNGQVPWYDFSTRQSIWDVRGDLFDLEDASASYFLEVVTETDPELAMPPSDSPFERMTEEEVAVFTEWINLGLPNIAGE